MSHGLLRLLLSGAVTMSRRLAAIPKENMLLKHADRTAHTSPPLAFSVVAATVILSACSGSDSPSNAPIMLSGQVVGSFIENARVCMDGNKNGQCDVGEIEVRSAKDGSFTLPVIAGADLLADVSTDAFTAEKSDFSDRKPVTARFILRSGNALWSQGGTSISVLTTMVSAEMDNGVTQDAASRKLAGLLAIDSAKILGNYNAESDAVVKGTLQGYARNLTLVLQDVATTVAAGRTASRDLQVETKAALTPASPAGNVKYVWTQVGADDTPFSKLEITAINPGAGNTPASPTLATNPAASGTSIGSATFTTLLASSNASLVTVGAMVARAIVVPDAAGNAACPKIRIAGVESTMTVRAPMVTGVASRGDFYGSPRLVDFPVLTCEARISATANSVSVNGRPLKVSNSAAPLNRILVVGDTGCRVKGPTAFTQTAEGIASGGDRLQDCTSEAAWPYARLARVAASFNPDMVVHNGDMHYREGFPEGVETTFGGAANAAGGGTQQDNSAIKTKFGAAGISDSINYSWRAWEEDFFKGSGPLLGVAPWALTRGNHELCDRAAHGWFRFLDPRNFPKTGLAYARSDEPEYDGTDGAAANFTYVRGSSFNVAKSCSQYIDPVALTLGDLQLVLIDVGMMNDVPGLSGSMGATNGDHVRVARQLTAIGNLPASKTRRKTPGSSATSRCSPTTAAARSSTVCRNRQRRAPGSTKKRSSPARKASMPAAPCCRPIPR